MATEKKPCIIITGAAGNIGKALIHALCHDYCIIALDIHEVEKANADYICDLTSDESVSLALQQIRKKYGKNIKAVIHLAAYFDFSGHDSPLYKKINEEGTERLLKLLQDFNVGRFIYASTMLVHRPGIPGQKITEATPLGPRWIYPESKAHTESIVAKSHGRIPYTILRLAGMYDDETAVPTLSHQIARIYEKEFKSHLYSGNSGAGQAFIHKNDLVDAFVRTVERSSGLPEKNIILIGEPKTESYQALQNRIGMLVHGEGKWMTWSFPKQIAKPGAWFEIRAEDVIPDALDEGEKPFIRPFMVELASDHYELDISKAKEFLGWTPQHNLYDMLPKLVESLKRDPAQWYEKNGIMPPEWLESAEEQGQNPEKIRKAYTARFRTLHSRFLWAHFVNIMLAFWLMAAPATLGYQSALMVWNDILSGVALLIFGFISLSWRHAWARWVCGIIGLWLFGAPLLFWAPEAASFLNDTIIGMLVLGFAVLTRPVPMMSPTAAMTGPAIPAGWSFSPSSWFQRMPIIILAVVGFFISRYLAAYQLGHIETVWEPFFAGSPDDPKNGTEEIITSSVSEAWPVSDAGLGAVTYALEILTGIIGSARRWRTMPWLVMLFGFMIVPLGIVSITFIIIQPIVIGTWCTLCLIAAAAMLIQIPYSLDELIATGCFLWRRHKAGHPWLKIFFTGDTDAGDEGPVKENFGQPPRTVIREMLQGGVGLPWNLAACIAIGIWLMFTRMTLDTEGGMADSDHLIGALVVTVAVTALAETVRPVRFLIIPFGFALLITPFLFAAPSVSIISSVICGLALIGLSVRRGPVVSRYGDWDRFIW